MLTDLGLLVGTDNITPGQGLSDAIRPTLLPGFVPQTSQVIKSDLGPTGKAVYGVSIGSQPDGSIPEHPRSGGIGIHFRRLAGFGRCPQAVYSAMDPDAAEDDALDLLYQITRNNPLPDPLPSW